MLWGKRGKPRWPKREGPQREHHGVVGLAVCGECGETTPIMALLCSEGHLHVDWIEQELHMLTTHGMLTGDGT